MFGIGFTIFVALSLWVCGSCLKARIAVPVVQISPSRRRR